MNKAHEDFFLLCEELDTGLDRYLGQPCFGCIERGLAQEGIMPGGLKVRRRARQLHDKLQSVLWQRNRPNPLLANDWLSIYAMAVNEENAAGGRRGDRPDQWRGGRGAGRAALLAAFPSGRGR